MRHIVVPLGLAAAVLAGCSSGPDLGPVFDNEAGTAVTCLVHQTGEPGAAYVDPEQRNTGQVFAMMRYYTQFGAMPFCDGAPAGESDRAWAQAYLDLGGTEERVPTVLAGN